MFGRLLNKNPEMAEKNENQQNSEMNQNKENDLNPPQDTGNITTGGEDQEEEIRSTSSRSSDEGALNGA